MTTSTDLRLPGITFEAVPPELPDTLPRMDVASFVGFAAVGPLHVPVVVEDVTQFREVFGADAALARDPATGRLRHAYLGPAVEAFFRSGGRRCWVVRVAADEAARSLFPLTGLVAVDPETGRWQLARAQARAVGSWADDLAVAAVLGAVRMPRVTRVGVDDKLLTLASDAPLIVGDLLRLVRDGGRMLALLTVSSIRRAAAGLVIGWERAWVLSFPRNGTVPGSAQRAARVTVDGEVDLAEVPGVEPADTPGRVTLTFAGEDVPGPDDLLRLDFDDRSVMAVSVVGVAVTGEASVPDGAAGSLVTGDAWFVHEGSAADLAEWRTPVAERLNLSLTVWRGERLHSRIDGLGLDPRHPRYWATLPTDEQLFAVLAGLSRADGRGDTPLARVSEAGGIPGLPPLWAAVAAPRLALAGSSAPVAGSTFGQIPVWLPLALADTAGPEAARGPATDTGSSTRLARDGLQAFGEGLFLDGDLVDEGAATLLGRAYAKSSIVAPAQPLRGIHALLPIDEVTLVAVPDAGHAGWHDVVEAGTSVAAPPHLWAPVERHGELTLWWTPVANVAGYVVEQAVRPDLHPATVVLDGPAPLGPAAPPTAEPSTGEAVGMALAAADCPVRLSLRVRARGSDGRCGPWSNTVTAVLPPADFETCDGGVPAPVLALSAEPIDAGSPPTDDGWLVWEPRPDLAVEIERSADPGFETVDERRVVQWGRREPVPAAGQVDSFVRARYTTPGGEPSSAWSNTVVLPAQVRVTRVENPVSGEVSQDLLSVHRALLRMAGARGDLLAVLSMPVHYREGETVEHLSALTGFEARVSDAPTPLHPAPPMLDGGEAHVLSHGAVYHPWTVVRTATGLRPAPPDGAMTGVIAHRAIVRGAWITPGNQPVDSVVALTPTLDADAVGGMLAQGVNVLARRPAGFVPLAARTLSLDDALAPIGVRRLMILLRRLALRHGTAYVFEPHGHRFRSMVSRTFQTLLGELYQRGAFAGAVPSEAFRVVADASLNPAALTAAGRFVVELRVAPAQPLVFLRVRLVQSGPGELTVREV
ncbi:MAG: hypothetical protein EOP32_00365 [Rhodococcus sp. (in: high G+C Gram-positive bacteria)]|nr:MAG: hypothetical protein EOP32_00365 [Rhodococcus sp. (in: high G+C Gram-positive bacteria)]